MKQVLIALLVALGPFTAAAADSRPRSSEVEDIQAFLAPLQDKAESGDADAQYRIGVMYRDGKGVPRYISEALIWFRRAAEQNEARAQAALGDIYRDGQGVEQDDKEAADWYAKAAAQGEPHGQSELGYIYGTGSGRPKDLVLSYMWSSLAAAQGDEPAATNKAAAAARMVPGQIKRAENLAKAWQPTF